MVGKNNTLGRLIKLQRQQKGWTLRQMSDVVGIPLSTLAKVEADKLSLTYEKLQQFASRLGMSMVDFLAQTEQEKPSASSPVVTGRKSLTSKDNSIDIETPNYHYQYLCADLSNRRMVPIIVRVRADDLDQFGEPIRHSGEEFVYVLKGAIDVHMQFYRSVTLQVGQGVYLDSSMGHAFTKHDCDEAVILVICSSEDANLASELVSMAEGEVLERLAQAL